MQRWGNSLGLRIPKHLAQDVRVGEGTKVRLEVEDGRLVVVPLAGRRWTLGRLLAGVTQRNLHVEIDTGAPQGREAS